MADLRRAGERRLHPGAAHVVPHQPTQRYGDLDLRLEKIKTIGDAYIVAGGLPEPGGDHVASVAHMALDMLEAVEAHNEAHDVSLALRVGIHTGPVVAGVIGMNRFSYDSWGDTVNTASRMESHGLPGRIQVTRETHDALADRFDFQRRGEVDVKGKGLMETWLLLGPEPGVAAVSGT